VNFRGTDADIAYEYLRVMQGRDPWSYIPHRPTSRQQAFLDLEDDEALYGGAAGGGKSDALLMAALLNIHVPGYAAILFRRTYTDLALPGAIMERADAWLRNTSAHWDGLNKRWTFPSGATLTFGYLDTEKDKYRYQGAELQFVGFDELTQFGESQYRYLLSRLRRKEGFPVRPRARAASNPGGIGHEWVFKRFVSPATASAPFVAAKLDDNPHVDAIDYKARLEKLDSVTRAQLLDGLWVQDGQGLVYRYDRARNRAEEMPAGEYDYVLAVDLGASEIKPTTAFCLLAFSWTSPTVYAVKAWKAAGLTPSSIAEEIRVVDGECPLAAIVVDQGGLGRGYIKEFRERYQLPAEDAKKVNKLGYRKLLNGALETGELRIVEPQCMELVDELETLSWNEKGTDALPGLDDHCTDALLYGWRRCKAHLHEPTAKKLEANDPTYLDKWAEEVKQREIEQGQRGRDRPWWAK